MRGPPEKRSAPAGNRGARKSDLAGKADHPENSEVLKRRQAATLAYRFGLTFPVALAVAFLHFGEAGQ